MLYFGNVDSDGKQILCLENYFSFFTGSSFQTEQACNILTHAQSRCAIFHIYTTVSACCKCVVGEMYLSCHIIQAKISPYHCWKSFLIFLLCVQYACFKITAPFSLNGTPSNRSVSSVPKGNVPLSLFHLQQGFFSGLLSHDIVQPHPHSHVSVFTILPVQVGFLTSVWSNSLGIWSVCSLLFVTRD